MRIWSFIICIYLIETYSDGKAYIKEASSSNEWKYVEKYLRYLILTQNEKCVRIKKYSDFTD